MEIKHITNDHREYYIQIKLLSGYEEFILNWLVLKVLSLNY